jgi:phospholipid/cholesterol/gamma-HCH transport system substrate-binding protein
VQKQAPSLRRVVTMVGFALSCFGLLLFLWLSFGGSIPLKPQSYRIKVGFPEATQLGLEADVRVAGVSVGKVVGKELDPRGGNRTLATIELTRRFTPLHSDAHAILRQKTLLGETYVELTPGTRRAPALREGARLADAQVQPTVELDEILNAFDPGTRQAFHIWQQELARTITNRGQDFSDALGNLPAFSTDTTALLRVLNDQASDVSRLVRNTGTVFEALSNDATALHDVITNSEDTFHATAAQNEALAQTFAIFPTFLRESRLTFAKLQTFALNTDPLIRDLKPVARDLRPTVHSVRLLAPDLRRLFVNLDPLIKASKKGLPALRDTLRGLGPNGLLDATGPFLSQFNPILQFLELYQKQVSDFIAQGKSAVAATVTSATGGVGHYLRQIGPLGPETVSIYKQRPNVDRGNTYVTPTFESGRNYEFLGIFPNWDCKPSGGPVEGSAKSPPNQPPNQGTPPCWVAPTIPFQGQNQRYPHVNAANYAH